MGIRFRKSINLGPLRINISKSGIGYSFGVKGARVTKTATGRKRATLSVPGTGLSYVKDFTKEADEKKKEQADLRYKAESYINTFEKALKDEKMSAQIPADQKEQAKKMVDELKKLLEDQK